tara:strand:- start:1753 stop:2091 length:339 start_codon:yes stop_codon:yes gene_type:complete
MPVINRKKYKYTLEGKKDLVKDLNKIEQKLLLKKHQKDYFKYLDFKISGDLEDQKEAKNIKISTRKLILQKENMQNALNKMDKKEYGIYGYKKVPLKSKKDKILKMEKKGLI